MRSGEFTRAQLVGMLASMRASLHCLIQATEEGGPRDEDVEGDLEDARELMKLTTMDVSPEDLLPDGGFDQTWRDG